MNSNGIISSPVSIDDVKTVLGENSNDLATLCQSTKINMWAKYKPVILAVNSHVSEFDAANNDWKTTSTWWKGTDGQCGIQLTAAKASTYKNVAALYDGNLNGWSYNRPAGGASSPFRLEDFIGYVHTAVPTVSGFSGTDIGYTDRQIEFSIAYTAPGGAFVSLDDIIINDMSVSEMYFGIYIKGDNAEVRLTAAAAIGNGGTSVSVNGNKLVDGTYTVYPFLSSEEIGISDADQAADFYTLPSCKVQTMKVIGAAVTVEAHAMSYSATANTATCYVNVQNMTSQAVTLTSLILESRISQDGSSSLKFGEHRVTIVSSSVAIPARSTKIYTQNIGVPLDDYAPSAIYIHATAVVSNKSYSSGYAALG
jgi:hypothetical protein